MLTKLRSRGASSVTDSFLFTLSLSLARAFARSHSCIRNVRVWFIPGTIPRRTISRRNTTRSVEARAPTSNVVPHLASTYVRMPYAPLPPPPRILISDAGVPRAYFYLKVNLRGDPALSLLTFIIARIHLLTSVIRFYRSATLRLLNV
jgi:hypothetical protein